jgi:hypothetical protein
MNRDRGNIDQGGAGTSSLGGGAGGQDFAQPQWNMPTNKIVDHITSLESFVIVGTKNGQPFVASTEDKVQAQNLLKQYARDLLPQTA